MLTPLLFHSAFVQTQPSNDYVKLKDSRETKLFTKTFSQERLHVNPTNRRLQGLGDTIKLLAGPLIWLANTIFRAVASFFSWVVGLFSEPAESILEGLSHKNVDQPLLNQIRAFQPKKELGEAGIHDHQENALIMLRSCVDAYHNVYPKNHVKLDKIIHSRKLRKLLNSPATISTAKKIKQAFVNEIPKGHKSRFRSEVNQARGRLVPTELTRTFEIEHHNTTVTFTEKSKNIDTSLGAKYLENISPKYFYDQINYINAHNEGEHIGIRPSTVRTEHHAQGMTTNAREHLIRDANNKELISTLRSGAFAVHDKYYPTESEFRKLMKNDEKVIKKLAKRWNIDQKEVVKVARGRIEVRRHLCVAQALPKVMASVKKMAADGLSPEHGFLHVEQSLLSDKFPNDREMIKDMAVAMATIRKHATVRFTDAEESVIRNDGKLVINLTTPKTFQGTPGKEYSVHAVFFSQGMNEMQSMGHAFGSGGETLQDIINRRGLIHLQQYAQEEGVVNAPGLNLLAQHYSPYNNRRGKDLKGVKLIARAVNSLGGMRGFVCKSGKDRTGSEANDELAYYAARSMNDDEGNESLRKKIRDNLAGGISWTITGQCNGNPNTYAFNEFQYPALPSMWKPPLRLCGNAKS